MPMMILRIVVFILAIIIIARKPKNGIFTSVYTYWLFGALVLLPLPALITAPYQWTAWQAYLNFLILFLMVVILTHQNLHTVYAFAFLVSAGFQGFLAILQSIQLVSQVASRPHGTFTDPNNLGLFCSLAFMVGSWLYHHLKNQLYLRSVTLIFMVFSLLGCIVSASRLAILTLLLGLITIIGWQKPRIFLIVATLSIVIISVTPNPITNRLHNLHNDPYAYSRLQFWQRAFALSMAEPDGIGLGHYKYAAKKFNVETNTMVRRGKYPHTAHNIFLQHMVEIGIIPTLFLWGILLSLIFRIIRQQTHMANTLLFTSYGIALALGLFAANAWHNPVLLLCLAWLLSHSIPQKSESLALSSAIHAVITIGITALLVATTLIALQMGLSVLISKSAQTKLKEQPQQAIYLSEIANSGFIKNQAISLLTARSALMTGNTVLADQVLTQAIDLNPLAYRPYLLKAQLLARQKESADHAEQWFVKALQAAPVHVTTYFYAAQYYFAQQKPFVAIALLETALTLEPHFLRAYKALFTIYTDLNNQSRAQYYHHQYKLKAEQATSFHPVNTYMQEVLMP